MLSINNFEKIDDDALALVFDKLDLEVIRSAAFVCKRFYHEATRSERLARIGVFKFQEIIKTDYAKISPEEIPNSDKLFHKLREVTSTDGFRALNHYARRKLIKSAIEEKQKDLELVSQNIGCNIIESNKECNFHQITKTLGGLLMFLGSVFLLICIPGLMDPKTRSEMTYAVIPAGMLLAGILCCIPEVTARCKKGVFASEISTLSNLEAGITERSPLLRNNK